MFSEKTCPGKSNVSRSLGSAFLAGAFVFCEKHPLKKAMSLGLPFLAGALVFLGKKNAQEKNYGPPIGVPSRGSCFQAKHDLKSLEASAIATFTPTIQKTWSGSASHSKWLWKWLSQIQVPSHSQAVGRGDWPSPHSSSA